MESGITEDGKAYYLKFRKMTAEDVNAGQDFWWIQSVALCTEQSLDGMSLRTRLFLQSKVETARLLCKWMRL